MKLAPKQYRLLDPRLRVQSATTGPRRQPQNDLISQARKRTKRDYPQHYM